MKQVVKGISFPGIPREKLKNVVVYDPPKELSDYGQDERSKTR